MSQISKYPIPARTASEIFEIFIKSLVAVKNKEDASTFAEDLFTPTEKVMLAKRLAIAFLLLKEYRYREISQALHVSLGTVATVSMSLQHGNNGYKLILEKVATEEKFDIFFSGILEKMVSIPAAGTKGSQIWKYLRDDIKNKKPHKNNK